MANELPEIDSVPQVAARYGLDPQHLYRLINNEVLPAGVAIRLGRRLFVNRERFDDFISRGGAGYPGGWRREAK